MNQIKQKIKEIGLSQREISKRLGKNASYLAGVLRTGLSTAKQAELMDGLDTVANGGTILSDGKLLELVDGAYDAVEIMRTDGSPYNTQWKKDWLTKAKECGANPSP